MKSLVVISPIAYWSSTAAMNAVLGYTIGDGVRLSADGDEPATHLGLHTWAGDDFLAIATGRVTPTVEGYTSEQINGLLAQLTVSPTWSGTEYVYPTDNDDVPLKKRDLFDSIISGMNLVLITEEIE